MIKLKELLSEIKFDSNGQMKIKKQYNNVSDFEKNAKNGDYVWVGKNASDFKNIGQSYLSKVVGKDSEGNAILTPWKRNKKYTIPQKDQLVIVVESLKEAKEEWVGLDTIKRGGYGSPTLRNGDKVRMVVDARKNKYYNGVINGNSIKWEDGAKSELSLSMQASNRGDLQVLRPTSKSESIKETKSDLKVYHKSYTEAIQTAKEYALKRGYMVDDDDSFRKIGMGPRKLSEGKTNKVSVELSKGGKPSNKQLHIQVYGMKNGYELNCYIN